MARKETQLDWEEGTSDSDHATQRIQNVGPMDLHGDLKLITPPQHHQRADSVSYVVPGTNGRSPRREEWMKKAMKAEIVTK